MKRIILFSYISTVLFLSATAEASMSSIGIGQIDYDQQSHYMFVGGRLPNPCLKSPRPTAVISEEQPRVILLQVIATQTGEFCAQVLGRSYSMEFNLVELIRNQALSLDPSATYTVKTVGYPFAAEISGAELL